MNKKRKGLLIGGIILLIGVGIFCYFNYFKLEPITNSEGTIVVERPEAMDDDPNSISCYDYIIQTMEAPEYWDESVWIPYTYHYEQAPERDLNAEAKEAFINGTGYRLKDINTATFERGYETKLTVNFSNNTAYNIEQEDFNWSTDDDYESPVYMFYSWDFNKHIYKNGLIDKDGNEKKDLTANLSNYYEENGPEEHRDFVDSGTMDLIYWHKKSIQDYEAKFSSAGCPLLNKPEGTLEYYKTIKAHPVEDIVDDGLIHAPWEQEGYTWDYTQNDDIVWGTSIEEVCSIELPYTEPTEIEFVRIDGTKEKINVMANAPAFAVQVDKEIDQIYFDEQSDEQFENVNILTGVYSNITGAMGTYVLTPLLKNLYGHNAVILYDGPRVFSEVYSAVCKELPNPKFTTALERENWPEKINTYMRIETNPKAINPGGAVWEMGESALADVLLRFDVKRAYKALNAEWPLADEYMHNFYLLYSQRYQRAFGLR